MTAKTASKTNDAVLTQTITREVAKRVVGQDVMVERLLIGLLTGGHILLEGSPPGFDARAVKDDIRAALPYVLDVHHVHAWSISEERPMVTLHANVAASTNSTDAVRDIKRMLAEHFKITHATVEIEYGACVDDPHPHSAC